MLNARRMWAWAVGLPILTFLGLSMCVWPAPRFLGSFALNLLTVADLTILAVLVAIPASIYFAITGVLYWKTNGELRQRFAKSLACLCFTGLWILAFASSLSLRHDAFIRASHVGDRIVEAIAQHRKHTGEFPERLDQIVPEFIGQIPGTGMIGYPEFTYRKGYNDIELNPKGYELRINCSSGGINFDRFIYWPSESYPDTIQGNGVERIRTWAYVHE